MEHGAVGGVHLVGAVHPAGADHAEGGLAGEHGARLHGGGVGAQHHVVVNIEGILGIPGGVVLGNVHQLEVVVVQLYFRAAYHIEAHAQKNFFQLAQHQLKRVAPALCGAAAGQRYVHGLCGQALRQHGV